MNKIQGLLLLLLLLSAVCSAQQQSGAVEIDEKVENLLAKMTLEEKVGQMNLYNGFWEITGPAPTDGNAKEKYENLRKGMVGAMLNVKGVENVRKIQKIVVEESRLGIPLLFGYDVIHGHKTLAPIPLAEAASWDLAAIEQSARIAAIEASAVGINWTFAPMVDISRDARWGRVMEGAGEDPYLGSLVAAARVSGFQGKDLSENNTIAATTKHFAAYGFAEGGREYNTADIGTSTLYNMVLPPFKATVDAGVKSFMNSFNILNGIPATGDAFLQREILKGEWGFDGFVVSDWASVSEIYTHGFAKDTAQTAEIAANAGCDMDMESYVYLDYLADAVREGKVEESKVDDAVRRILKVKYELGLFDDPYRYCSEKREQELLYHPDHAKAVLDVAKRSIVLLKNERDLLPLSKEQDGIVVIGELAKDKSSPLGSWRLGSDDETAISFLEGFKSYQDDVTYVSGPSVFTGQKTFIHEVQTNETDRKGIAEAVVAAKNAKVVVMVLGEHGFQSGEGRSRAQIDLPGLQQELLEAVYKVNQNVVLVLMNGRPLALPWAAENIPAILETWQLGTQTGNAIAQVLFGDYNPSGKLPMSFPRSVGQIPIAYNRMSTGRPAAEPIVFWSHYTDEKNDPLFPFGHGKSYTTFEYSNLKIDASDPAAVKVSVTVKNTGDVAGEEVTQLYLQDKYATVVRPIKELKGFQKYELAAGASKNLSFTLTDKELGFFDNQGNFKVESGTFGVMVGTSSVEGLSADFELNIKR
ncbi:MAG: beta-glucosidase BglX [Bacteroidota bacterium]